MNNNILLDSCSFLWAINSPDKLSNKAIEIIENYDSNLFLSPVSLWELKLKSSTGKLKLPNDLIEYRDQLDTKDLPLRDQDTNLLDNLPNIHKDPFDRILICQAINNGMTIVTPDKNIQQYPVKYCW